MLAIEFNCKFSLRRNVAGFCLWLALFAPKFGYVDGLRLFCGRYKPETGDIIVGRVVEVRRKSFDVGT